jgi:hypothetical protein
MDFVTVFSTLNPAEADLVRTQLEAADFDCTIANELSTLTFGPPAATAAGILVKVPQDQAQSARELLASTISAETPSAPSQ